KAAYEALQAYAPGLPELTTVFITHSHWDHVGGHRYFRRLNPRLKFYARNNYTEEIADATGGPAFFGRQFFGERYDIDDVRSFKRSEEHTSELQSPCNLVCRLLLEKKKMFFD